jgi:type I restriction enzyme S subunit
MFGWLNTTLGEFVALQRGHDLTDSERRSGQVPVMGSAGQNGFHDTAIARGPGIVIGRSGASFGKVHFSPTDYWPHNTTLYVTDFKGNDERFAFYFLNTIDFSGYNSGSAQPSLNRNFIYSIPVCIPFLAEQKTIASVLGALDDKIELNRRMNETLEALTQNLFENRFVDAAAAKLPKGWREGSILEIAKLLSGGTPKTEREDYWNGNILWASAKDVSQCGQTFLVATERTITAKGLEESSTQVIPACCTVVVARGATTGRMTMFGREMAMNQTCYGLSSTTGNPFALYCLLRSAIDSLLQTAHGSVFDTITTTTFAASKVTLPTQDVFDSFEKAVSPLFQRILANIEESRTLAELRDALLPKLLSGELRVPILRQPVGGSL